MNAVQRERLSIGNKIYIQVIGKSPLIDKLLRDFSIYRTNANNSDIRLIFSEKIDPTGFKIMFHPAMKRELEYSYDHLIINSGRGLIKVSINPTAQLTAEFDESISNSALYSYVISVFQSILRQALIPKGGTILHASAVGLSNKAIIFTAWQHTGKTDLMLYFIKNGATYMSDDHIILLDEKAYPFPTYLNLFDYNFRSHPWIIKRLNRKIRIKYKVDQMVRRALKRAPRKARRAYEILFPAYQVHVNPENIGIKIEKRPLRIGALAILERSKNAKRIEIREDKISEKTAMRLSINIALEDIAYNLFVIQYAFPQFYEHYMNIQKKEIENLMHIFEKTKVFHITLPETGLRSAVNISELRKFIENLSESL